jgi:hypothetical protein
MALPYPLVAAARLGRGRRIRARDTHLEATVRLKSLRLPVASLIEASA